jgi:hypothetical protein
VHNRACLYGNIKNGEMLLNDAGQMVENEWLKLLQRFPNIQLHEYVVMPNHFHAIMEMVGSTLVVDPNDEMVAHNMGQHEKGQPPLPRESFRVGIFRKQNYINDHPAPARILSRGII